MEKKKEKGGFNINAKSFLISLGVIFGLMIFSYVLTFVVPGGQYERIINADGNEIINTAGGFTFTEGGISFWEWILSPFLVLTSSWSGTLIAIIAFLLVIGGIVSSLEKCGLMKYMVSFITHKFRGSRYKLMAVLIFVFMAMGSMIGSFEEVVPIIPIITAVTVAIGWDAVTGIAVSLLAAACGFAAGVCNPFTVGVAQKLAGLPMFSGVSLRILSFVLIYGLLLFFVYRHAKKIERSEDEIPDDFVYDKKLSKALISFAVILGAGIATVFLSSIIPALQDYTMIIVAVMFLVSGVVSVLIAGMHIGDLFKTFLSGVVGILPAVFMILMASSIKYILEEALVLDTILYFAINAVGTWPKAVILLFIYLIVLVLNFFVASGSAKAFMIIPLITPMAAAFGIPAQLCVLAYAFGDGFSNAFYPTNAALLIGLNVASESYGKWAKWTVKFQLLNILLTSGILLLGLAIGYGA